VRTERRAYLGLGSNLGDRLANLQAAIDGLLATPGVSVVAVSRVYETDPIGPEQPEYLNAVVALDTDLSARRILEVGQRLEQEAHRERRERWGPRTLDVDVLLVGDEQIDEPDLEVPHPRLHERKFVRVPLADVAPDVEVSMPPLDEDAEAEGVRATDLALTFSRG
jgi:2-amino-4-hydroxy-6-hydroxymethyldihydropteridine diphosphokinase